MRELLPELLREIAELTDVPTALAVAAARGGTTTAINARLSAEDWLVQAVGMDKAKIISHHFTSGKARAKVFIPLGPAGSYQAERRQRAELMAKAEAEGLSANQAARRVGVTDRSIYAFRARSRRPKNSRQGSLF